MIQCVKQSVGYQIHYASKFQTFNCNFIAFVITDLYLDVVKHDSMHQNETERTMLNYN